MNMSMSEKLAEALFEIITERANEADLKNLRGLVTEYKTKYPRSYAHLKHKSDMGANLFNAIEEAVTYADMPGDVGDKAA